MIAVGVVEGRIEGFHGGVVKSEIDSEFGPCC